MPSRTMRRKRKMNTTKIKINVVTTPRRTLPPIDRNPRHIHPVLASIPGPRHQVRIVVALASLRHHHHWLGMEKEAILILLRTTSAAATTTCCCVALLVGEEEEEMRKEETNTKKTIWKVWVCTPMTTTMQAIPPLRMGALLPPLGAILQTRGNNNNITIRRRACHRHCVHRRLVNINSHHRLRDILRHHNDPTVLLFHHLLRIIMYHHRHQDGHCPIQYPLLLLRSSSSSSSNNNSYHHLLHRHHHLNSVHQ